MTHGTLQDLSLILYISKPVGTAVAMYSCPAQHIKKQQTDNPCPAQHIKKQQTDNPCPAQQIKKQQTDNPVNKTMLFSARAGTFLGVSQTSLGAHPASYSILTEVFTGNASARAWSLDTGVFVCHNISRSSSIFPDSSRSACSNRSSPTVEVSWLLIRQMLRYLWWWTGTSQDLCHYRTYRKNRRHKPFPKLGFETAIPLVRLHVLTVASTKMTDFWDVAPCNLIKIYRRFWGAWCLHHQGDHRSGDGSATSQKTVIFISDPIVCAALNSGVHGSGVRYKWLTPRRER
jgi:hypothetical protein